MRCGVAAAAPAGCRVRSLPRPLRPRWGRPGAVVPCAGALRALCAGLKRYAARSAQAAGALARAAAPPLNANRGACPAPALAAWRLLLGGVAWWVCGRAVAFLRAPVRAPPENRGRASPGGSCAGVGAGALAWLRAALRGWAALACCGCPRRPGSRHVLPPSQSRPPLDGQPWQFLPRLPCPLWVLSGGGFAPVFSARGAGDAGRPTR